MAVTLNPSRYVESGSASDRKDATLRVSPINPCRAETTKPVLCNPTARMSRRRCRLICHDLARTL
jgi:hypothetical protein